VRDALITLAPRILVVERRSGVSAAAVRDLRRAGCRLRFVHSAAEVRAGAAELRLDEIDCLLCRAPVEDEPLAQFIAWIRAVEPALSVILIGDDDDTLSASGFPGVTDVLTAPVDPALLGRAVADAARSTRSQRRLELAESELAAVGRTQEQMLNAAPVPAIPADVCFYPKLDAGGDFFTQFRLDQTRHLLIISDVSGHDLQAAYLSAYFHGVVRGMVELAALPNDVLAFFNRFLVSEWNLASPTNPAPRGLPASAAVCALAIDTDAQTVDVVNCGAPAPGWTSIDGRINVLGRRGGAPVGWFENFSPAESSHSIAGGGSLLLWSDGLDQLAHAHDVSVYSAAFALSEAWTLGVRHPILAAAGDDVLLVRLYISPHSRRRDYFHPLIMWRYRGDQAADIDDMVAYWRRSLRLALPDLSKDCEHDLLLASREAVLNAMNHGCNADAAFCITYSAAYSPSKGLLRIRVEDPGPGHSFDCTGGGRADSHLRADSRGLMLIQHLASDVRYERNRASIIMDFLTADPARPDARLLTHHRTGS